MSLVGKFGVLVLAAVAVALSWCMPIYGTSRISQTRGIGSRSSLGDHTGPTPQSIPITGSSPLLSNEDEFDWNVYVFAGFSASPMVEIPVACEMPSTGEVLSHIGGSNQFLIAPKQGPPMFL